jgi:cytochrome c oxidase cbb3-type subunit I/II
MSTPAANVPLDTIAYDDKATRNFALATVIWGVVGMLVGVIISLQLAWPLMMETLKIDVSFLSYGRLRPLHTNAVIFAFVGNAVFAGVYYSLQRLLKARMFSDALTKFHFWGWQAIIVAAAITLPLGYSTSKEYAELEWPIDIAIALVWVGFGANMIGTIIKRREPHLYVAIWFYLATWFGITMLHVVNSLEIPAGPFKSYSVYAGVQDALVQWWYGHNAVAFFLTTPFLGLMYYFIPKISGRPVYSYRLSIVHFWSLIFLYIWSGPHHLLNSAAPDWLQTLGVVFSVMLLAPSWGGGINGLLTLRGAFDQVRRSAVLKFLVAAITFYMMSTFEGPLLSIREVNALSHNTDWTIGHAHSGALGWNGLLAFGIVYWLIPRIYKTTLHSEAAANLHFWIAIIAIALYTVSMWIAGIMQGMMQLQFDDKGYLVYSDWLRIVQENRPYYWLRVVAGVLYLVGGIIAVWNVVVTIRRAKPLEDESVRVARMTEDPAVAKPVAAALAVPGGAVAKTNALHGLLERWPTLFMGLIAVALVVGGLFEIVPSMIQGALSPRIATVTPYTPLELAGRDLYIREGCVGCHTQMVRTLRAEVERYKDPASGRAEYSRPGEAIFDRPFLWGSKRTGPDLAREGMIKAGDAGAAWHYRHFDEPQKAAEGTVMPHYRWLITNDLTLSDLPAKMRAQSIRPLLETYTDAQIASAVTDAEAQARQVAASLRKDASLGDLKDIERKEIVAMIAYLQRLGVDLFKPVPAIEVKGAVPTAGGKP